jgi:hypothetical protein
MLNAVSHERGERSIDISERAVAPPVTPMQIVNRRRAVQTYADVKVVAPEEVCPVIVDEHPIRLDHVLNGLSGTEESGLIREGRAVELLPGQERLTSVPDKTAIQIRVCECLSDYLV